MTSRYPRLTSRRQWLKRVGLGAAALSLPNAIARIGSKAFAEPDAPPLRFVVFYDHVGFIDRLSRIRGGATDWDQPGALLPTASQWRLPPGLAPLEPFRSRMVPLVGLDMRSDRVRPQPGTNGGGHGNLATNALTASPRVFFERPGGASIDQRIADGLYEQGVVTSLHSLFVSVGAGRGAQGVFRPDGRRVRPIWQPPDVYDLVFPHEIRADRAERDRLGRGWAAAETLASEIADERERSLLGEQRARFREHRALRRSQQERLAARLNMDAVIPEREALLDGWTESGAFDVRPRDMSAGEAWDATIRINLDLVTRALQLDLTRVAVVSNSWVPYDRWYVDGQPYRPSAFRNEDHHAFHHTLCDATHGHGELGERFMESDQLSTFAEPLARLLGLLQEAEDSDGSRVLDNTIVLAASEMASPAHTGTLLNWSIFTGPRGAAALGGATLGQPLLLPRVGRGSGGAPDSVVPFGEWAPLRSARFYHMRGPSHAQLFQALGAAFGLPEAMLEIGPETLRPTPLSFRDPSETEVPAFDS